MTDTPAAASPAPATTDAPATIASAAAAPPAAAGAAVTATPPAAAVTTPPAAFVADWRTQMAGTDADALKRLERFAGPDAVFKSFREFERRQSSGELKSQLPKDATPEQLTAWRKENGIPADEKAYAESIKLPAGLVPAENDKPLIESFVKDVALARNLSPEVASEAVAWFMNKQDAARQEQIKGDERFHGEAQEKLITDMGKDYRPNLNAIGNMVSTWPDGVSETLFTARTPDGKLVGDHPDIVKALAQMAREVNPTATLVPAGTGNSAQAVDSEIKTLEGKMADKTSDYWNGPNREATQQRYRDLVTARDKISSRAA